MKKLTKREKFIIFASAIMVAGVTIKLKNDVFKAGTHYNKLADKLCSGGVWKAADVTEKGFKLVLVNCCGGCKGGKI